MKIAMLAPVAWRTPPRHYGPWEQVTSDLTEALVEAGVDVTLFATAGSLTNANLVATVRTPYAEDPEADAKVNECLHISQVMERAGEFDLIHNQFDFLPLTYSGLIPVPMLTTIHGFSSEKIVPVYKKYNGSAGYVSISDSNRHRDLDYMATVYNGINPEHFTFRENGGDYLLFFGRIHPHKGAVEAIRVARETGIRLIIAGPVQDQEYYDRQVAPLIDNDLITYAGNCNPDQRDRMLGGALALLHLISFDEPFGLSVAESMFCGTPVIAFRRGSMAELIADRESGFLVEDVQGAVRAVSDLKRISRLKCSEHARKKFARQKMAEDYLRVYARMIDTQRMKK